MTAIWLVSYIVLWLLVLGELLIIFALARQIGLLHSRLGPAGARVTNVGLELGQEAPAFHEKDLRGRDVTLGSERGKPTMLIFVSPGCSTCSELMPAVNTIVRREKKVELVIVSLLQDEIINRDFASRYKVADYQYIVAPHLSQLYQVEASPYAVLVDAEGKVFTKGITNHLEHLESLLNALDEGVPSYDAKMNKMMAASDTSAD